MTKRAKMDEPTAIKLLVPARTTREKMLLEDSEFAPMVIFAPRRGQAMLAVLEEARPLPDMLADLLVQMRERLGPAEWIAVTTDAYAKQAVEAGEAAPGQLAKAFADGDPDVIEQMVVILRHRYKPTEVATQTYRYIPSEGFEWDEPQLVENYEGSVRDILDYYII